MLIYGRIMEEKHAKLRKEVKQMEENFDFQPKINKKSELMVLDKSVAEENVETSSMQNSATKSYDMFNRLYEDGIKRKHKQMKLQSMSIGQECTFKPRLVSRRRLSTDNMVSHDESQL